MKKHILTQQEICWGEINSYQTIDLDKIKNLIIENSDVTKLKDLTNLFNDIRIPLDQNILWYNDYIRDKYKAFNMFTLTAEDWYGQILKPGENSYKRNHVNPNHTHRSPEFTSVLVLQGEGIATLEYDDNIDKGRLWNHPLQKHHFIVFNSSLDFFIHKNRGDKDLIYLVVHYKKF